MPTYSHSFTSIALFYCCHHFYMLNLWAAETSLKHLYTAISCSNIAVEKNEERSEVALASRHLLQQLLFTNKSETPIYQVECTIIYW
jgi:hypothetical protein